MKTLRQSLKSLAVCALVACGAVVSAWASWTYDETAKTVTDGNWTFNVSGERDALVIGRATGTGSTGLIDFTTGIEGGGAFGSVEKWWMWKDRYYPEAQVITEVRFADSITNLGEQILRTCPNLTTVKLPANLISIGSGAFMGCSKLSSVTPMLPDTLEYIAVHAFKDTKALKVDVVLRGKNLVLGNGSDCDYSIFNGSGILSCDLSESGVTETPCGFLRACPNLKWVKYPKTLVSMVAGGCHYSSSSLIDVQFNSFPDWKNDGSMLGSTVSMSAGGRICYPANDVSWMDYVARNPSFVSWEKASASYKNTYNSKFPDGPTPVGYATVAGNDPTSSSQYACQKWLVPFEVEVATCELSVNADPNLKIGTVTPDYGNVGTVDAPVSFSVANEYAAFGDQVYRCKGYKLGAMDGATVKYGELVEELSGTFDPAGKNGNNYICWVWEVVAHRVTVADFPARFGDHAIDEACFRDFAGFYPVNQPITVRATPKGEATFERWFGDVPSEQLADSQIQLTIDAPKAIVPYFSGKWVLNDAENPTSMTDGYWTFPVSGTREALAVGKAASAAGLVTLVDLRKGIEGGTILSIADSWFINSGAITEVRLPDSLKKIPIDSFRSCSNLKKVILPSQLEIIGSAAFYQSRSLTTLEPMMLPHSVTSITWAAFNGCTGLKYDLVLSNPKLWLGNAARAEEYGNSTFFGSGILTADLTKTRIVDPPYGLFRSCPNLTCVKYPKTLKELSGCGMHYDSPKLRDIQFQSWPTDFGTVHTDAFGGTPSGYGARIVYPAGDPNWTAYIEELKQADNFTAWADAGDNTNTYLSAFPDGWKPVGSAIIHKDTQWGNTRKWLVPHNFATGMKLLFR